MAGQKKQEQDINQLLKVRREKLADLQANGKNPFEIMKYDVTHHSEDIREQFQELEGKTVSVAGRMMSKRVMGKASFCHVQDLRGQIQSYVARDSLGEEAYKEFKKMDVGDIVGIKGEVSAQRPEKFLSMPRRLLCCQRVFRYSRRSIMD